MKTLLLIPSYAKANINADIAADCHPTMDYQALTAALSREPGDSVELLDYASVDHEQNPVVQLVCRLAGRDAALALMGFLRRHSADTIFTNSETLAIPLALLFRTLHARPRHVTIAHRLTAKKKQPFYRWLRVHREMDAIFVYSSAQRDFASTELGIPLESMRLIAFHADHHFFRPMEEVESQRNQICAAGLEWRDYPTLIKAVAGLTDLRVKLAAASPWSKHASDLGDAGVPAHVSAASYNYAELRSLYAQSSFVVVPLVENDFQAGVTTILEAMAMGKSVIVSGTVGQTDVIAHEQNGLYVEPRNAEALKQAIERVRGDDALRARLARAARSWVEEHATLERWVATVVAGIRGTEAASVGCDSRPSLQVSADTAVQISASMALFAAVTRQDC